MTWQRFFLMVVVFMLGFGFAKTEDKSNSSKRPSSVNTVAIQEGTPIRIIYPGEDGPKSVSLYTARIEREADTSITNPREMWTIIVGDPLEAAWVYAISPNP